MSYRTTFFSFFFSISLSNIFQALSFNSTDNSLVYASEIHTTCKENQNATTAPTGGNVIFFTANGKPLSVYLSVCLFISLCLSLSLCRLIMVDIFALSLSLSLSLSGSLSLTRVCLSVYQPYVCFTLLELLDSMHTMVMKNEDPYRHISTCNTLDKRELSW